MKKIVSVNCKACGAPITVDSSEETVRCQYCDAVNNVAELLNQTDEVQIEKIKAKAYKEVEIHKYDNEQAKEEIEKYKKSKLSKWTKIWAVISLLCGVATLSQSPLCFVVALIQCACLVVSYLMGMKIIPEKKKSLHSVLAFAGFLLTVAFFLVFSVSSGGSGHKTEKVAWENTEISELISKPETDSFNSYYNWDTSYSIDAYGITDKQYKDYVGELKENGFTIEVEEGNSDFSAFNEEGYQIDLHFYQSNKDLSINLYKPLEISDITWPTSELVSKMPVPKTLKGKISSESDKNFKVSIKNDSVEDYADYVSSCLDAGFDVDYERKDKYFSGKNKDGDSLQITYKGFNIMIIEIDKAEEPVIEEETKIEESVKENVEETTESTQNDTGAIRPEIKEAIDSYEKFVDEYCEFMKKYAASNGSDLGLLADYASYISKLADMETKMEKIEDEDLNTAEELYYSEVLLRCSGKMLKVAQ